jgi:hypothetical protein
MLTFNLTYSRYGARCNYAHGPSQLRQRGDPLADPSAAAPAAGAAAGAAGAAGGVAGAVAGAPAPPADWFYKIASTGGECAEPVNEWQLYGWVSQGYALINRLMGEEQRTGNRAPLVNM